MVWIIVILTAQTLGAGGQATQTYPITALPLPLQGVALSQQVSPGFVKKELYKIDSHSLSTNSGGLTYNSHSVSKSIGIR